MPPLLREYKSSRLSRNYSASDNRKGKSPAVRPGFVRLFFGFAYFEMRRFESAVPIEAKVVTIWFADVSRKNLSDELAQY